MRLELEPLASGALITAPDLPASGVDRARLLARVGRGVLRCAPDADLVIGGRSVLVLGVTLDALAGLALAEQEPLAPQLHSFDVVYDGADLDAVAEASGLTSAAVAALHCERSYVALVTGFMPGFAYLGELDQALVRPRHAQPRARVPAGSLAIADRFTGVYPFASPGGWNLLGRALDPRLFDPFRTPARRIAVLDEVRFVACAPPAPEARQPPQPCRASAPAIDARGANMVVVSSTGLATVQDEGRWGRRGEGVPWSGPLDADGQRAANAAVGNPAGAACVEVIGGRLVLDCLQRVWISEDGAPAHWAQAGDRIVIEPASALVAYLAVRGAIDVPRVLGSRSTLLVAGLGGHEGRALRAGDRLSAGDATEPFDASSSQIERGRRAELDDHAERPVTLLVTRAAADERLEEVAFDLLCRGVYSVSSSIDRVGVRLDGPCLPRVDGGATLPDPVLPGAIQITTAGTPIVLGPDAAVTGGYPVVGWLDRDQRSRLGRLRPGSTVVFRTA